MVINKIGNYTFEILKKKNGKLVPLPEENIILDLIFLSSCLKAA